MWTLTAAGSTPLWMLPVPLLDGDPDGLTPTLRLDDLLLQAMNPNAAVEHFTDFAVLAYEDATFCVFRSVARMDADALTALGTTSCMGYGPIAI